MIGELPARFHDPYFDDVPCFYDRESVELVIPSRPIYGGLRTRAVRSTRLRDGVWMMIVLSVGSEISDRHRAVPGTWYIDGRAYLYYADCVSIDWIVPLLTVGDLSDLCTASNILEIAVDELEREYRELDSLLQPSVQRVEVARRGFFYYPTHAVRLVIPLFVIDEYLWGLGDLLDSYIAYRELTVHFPGEILYYCMILGGARRGDRALQLIEFLRTLSFYTSGWAEHPRAYWDTIDRELRLDGSDYASSLRRLFLDDDERSVLDYSEIRDYSIGTGYWTAPEDTEDPESLWETEFRERAIIPITRDEHLERFRLRDEASTRSGMLQARHWDAIELMEEILSVGMSS